MRAGIAIIGLLILSTLSISSAPAEARPAAPAAAAKLAESPVLKTGHRGRHDRAKAHHGRYSGGRKTRYRTSRDGWLPPLKEHPHLPGRWNHEHCHDWHRCHAYFYGYEQWARWNPDKSRAYFRRHYHH